MANAKELTQAQWDQISIMATIGNAGKAILKAALAHKTTIDQVMPMIEAMAKRYYKEMCDETEETEETEEAAIERSRAALEEKKTKLRLSDGFTTIPFNGVNLTGGNV